MYRVLGRKRRDLRSRMSGFLSVLLLFTLLMILKQQTTTWEMLSPLNLSQYAPRSTAFEKCRQFPKEKRIEWRQLYYIHDRSKTKNLIWCKVPKAGSTTLARMFVHLAGAREVGTQREMHHTLRKLYPKLTYKVMARKLNTTFKLLVVRHPFERILSAYRDKLENYSRDPQFREHGKLMVKRLVENGTDVEPTFPEFVTYLVQTNPEKFNEHWMPISRLCAPCRIHYDAVVKMETFHMEIKVPLERVGIHEDIGWEHRTGTNRTTIERYFQQLSFTQIQKLYHVYQQDFLLFEYTPYSYFSIVAHQTAKDNNYI